MDSVSPATTRNAQAADAAAGGAKPRKAAPTRRRRKTDVARGEIIAAARELFAEKGYSNTTTRDIALRAKASEVLIFRYFQSKANLFRETVVVPFEEELKAFLAANPPAGETTSAEESRRFVRQLYERLCQHGDSLIALVAAQLYEGGAAGHKPGASHFRDYFNLAVEQMEDRLGRDGITPAIPLPLSNRIGFAAVVATALFRDWIFADTDYEDEEIVNALSDFILTALRAGRHSET